MNRKARGHEIQSLFGVTISYMWERILSFAQKRAPGVVRKGVLTDVDIVISAVRVDLLEESQSQQVSVPLDAQDCHSCLRDLARLRSDHVRIECDLASSQQSGYAVMELHLAVNPEVIDQSLERVGTFDAEEFTIQLARAVWREARVPVGSPLRTLEEDGSEMQQMQHLLWRNSLPLYNHQTKSVEWMTKVEERGDRGESLLYAGNLQVTSTWYLDTENECFTQDPSVREAHLSGGVCADGTGMGKTATTLHHLTRDCTPRPPTATANGSLYVARGALVILPLNLVAQWQGEVAKFFQFPGPRTVWLVQGKDARHVTMQQLCDAHIVFTTFSFLRTSKVYAEMLETSLQGRPRTRAALSAWARQPGRTEPVVEAITWHRIVIDEIHQTFESSRDLRHLRLIDTRHLWGLTATPVLEDTQRAQHLYLFLCREKAHHPNLLARLIVEGVCGVPSVYQTPTPSLQRVVLSEEERAMLPPTALETIRAHTHIEITSEEKLRDASDIERQMRQSRQAALTLQRAKVAGHARTLEILERAKTEMEEELQTLAQPCAEGDAFAQARADVVRQASETHTADVLEARRLHEEALVQVERCLAADQRVSERVEALRLHRDICSICLERPCGVITPCVHLFCPPCLRKHTQANGMWCPTCRASLAVEEGIVGLQEVSSKMMRLGDMITSLHPAPVILFVQWKTMLRGMRAFLRGLPGIRVFSLDGNSAQRTFALTEFLQGGVLLLCLEESFAGLHLPHARHVVFAHAIVGDQGEVERLERQAVARCVRHGQTEQVHVYSFVVADSAEEHLWHTTHQVELMDTG